MSKADLDRFNDFMVEYKKEVAKDYEEEIERLNKENTILRQNSQYLVKQKDELEEEIERLNNKLLKIKELINRTPRQTPKEIAYIMLKSEIAEVIGVDKECKS